MSSSVFVETPRSASGGDSSSLNGDTNLLSKADSNLVVVYGKNGINVDRQGLKDLIDEKTLTSISVIRITSPTPSMEDEEAEEIRKEAEQQAQEDDETNSSVDEEDEEENSDSEVEEKTAKPTKTPAKTRPEILGLSVEEFYPPNEARELAKEILKYAGVTPLKCNVDYEFQRYIIKNDHCYTPFTSPSQVNDVKLNIENETKQPTTNIRKLPITTTTTVKQYLNKRKQNMDEQQRKVTDKDREKSVASDHDESLADDSKTAEDDQDEEEGDEDLDDDGSDYTAESEESAESDNDRDSDSDFDVNNRHGKKRKNFVAKRKKKEKQRARSLIIQKAVNNKRRLHSQDHIPYDEEMKNSLTPMKIHKQPQDIRKSESSFNPVKTIAQKQVREDVEAAVIPTIVLAPPSVDPPAPPRQLINIQSVQIVKPANKVIVNPSPVQVRTYQMKPIAAPTLPAAVPASIPSASVQASPQNVKQIVINKVIASPKGGFTDLSTLLARSDNTQSNVRLAEINSDKQPLVKGFMPLGIDTAAKNQLPAQISIQTHQSSSEIAAENDKQLDLIDSIVKNELDRTFKPTDKSTIKENSIPDLVKMLESTEKAVLEKNKISSSFTSSSVEAIDIANAQLLETADDDIPEDLLQHVVELMEDKSLQEAVEKEVLQQQEKQQQEKQQQEKLEFEKQQQQQQQQQQQLQLKQQIKPIILPQSQSSSTTLPHPIRQLPQTVTTTPLKQPKSIIEASISNTTTPNSSRDTTPTPTLNRSTNVTYLRREPIQIVRGNGRVITLPPIEAPTTRAKRRAQTQPTSDTSFNDSESCDVSMHSDTSLFADSHAPEKGDPVFTPNAQQKEKVVKAKGKKKATAKSVKSIPIKVHEEGDSQEDEDDPNKLWCICRQPHNNRFMICCDVCEDWFHGTCVSITKAMGLEMEQNGVEWTCPKCVKKQETKKQRKITELFENKKTLVQFMPQLDVEKKSSTPVQSKITDVFNKKTLVQLMPKLEEQAKPSRSSLNQSNITLPEVPSENKHIIDLKNLQSMNQSNITLQEVPGENKHIIDLKKLQPGQFYTLTRTPTTKKVQAVKTPESIQPKAQEVVLKKSSAESGNVVGNVTKRVIVLPSTQKPLSRGVAMVKATALQQQQLKFAKVPTAAEKKQFTIAKVQPNKNAQTSAQNSLVPDSLDLPANSSMQQTKSPVQKQPPIEMLTCIVCKKQARANSIYCSDDCIRKHAQNALNAVKVPEPVSPATPVKLGPDEKKKKSKGLFEDLLSMADRKPKVERVSVLERRTGKLLTGNNAPTTLNLKKWLQDNPTFEVVQPGSVHAQEIEKSKQKARPNVQSPTNINTFMPLKADGPIVTSVITLTPPTMSSPQPVFPTKSVKQQDLNKSNTKSSGSTNVQRSTTPKHLVKQPHQLNIKTDKSEKEKDKPLVSPSLPSSSQKVLKKQLSAEKESSTSQTPVRETSEPVRVNVRRTLKEQLLIRIKELSDEKKLSLEQVEEFVKTTELEMYRLFNKDIGAKYKAKYRSLMFNIKDRKNETLLLKICGKLIEPRQLVRMSPEEMASQELAQWRENEAKHQLEMIKKSELDMLSCTKTYVLKTHKGEEVIEGKQADRLDLDISIPVEDVVTVLNNSTVSSTTEVEASSLTPRKDNSFEMDYSVLDSTPSTVAPMSSLTPVSLVASTSSDKKKAASKERERDREKRHKSKDRHREKSRKRSRSRSRERHHKSSSRKDERREKEERSAAKKEELESMVKSTKVVAVPTKQPLPLTQAVPAKSIAPAKPVVKKSIKNPPPSIEKFNLIDQILESTKTVEQAANLQKEKPAPVVAPSAVVQTTTAPVIPTDSPPETALKLKPQSPSAPDSDQEPSSTVSISTPPEDPYYKYSSDGEASMWTGSINMIDVASFQVSIQTVSGNTYLLSKDLPEELDIVGRISPDTVWDYIGKIKRSPNKEVVVIRLVPSGESETNAYTILYKYLDKRKRLGVIKTTSSNIKDFYIMPLGVGQQMPSVLQPSENFEFYDDVMRPDMLLGIVIRIMGKRHSNASMRRKKEATVISNRTVTSAIDADGTATFTPPGSPKPKNKKTDLNRSMHAAGSSRGIRMQQKSIDDEEIDIDAIIKAPITAKKNTQSQPNIAVATKKDDADEPYSPGGGSSDDEIPAARLPGRDDDLKRKMDEINRQIEAQKMEIAGLLSHDQSSSLANISIPSNLHQILASIQSKPEPPSLPSTSGNVPTMVPPPPMIGSLSHHSAGVSRDEEYKPEQPTMHNDPKPSRLAQLSEAELLSMVPDNIDLDRSNTSSHNTSGTGQPPEKRPRWSEPPPPGMESEYN